MMRPSTDLVQIATELGSRGSLPPWPDVLRGDGLDTLRTRIEAALTPLSPAGRASVEAGLDDTESVGLLGLARLWSLGLAAVSDWQLDAVQGGALIVARGEQRAALLPACALATPTDQAAVRALEQRLAPLFGDRAWGLVLRRPLPPDLDPERVLEPVRVWLVAVDRGRWDGDYAIYEDGEVSVELRLMGGNVQRAGPTVRVPARDGDHRALLAASLLEQSLAQADDVDPSVPRVPILVGPAPWAFHRRRRLELLYGKLQEVVAADAPRAFTATFRRSSTALFGQAAMSRVGAVWWLGCDPADALTPQGEAHENPWGEHPAEGPLFPGERLSVTATGDDAAGAPASLSLQGDAQRLRVVP